MRSDLDIHEGDLVAIRVHAPYATFCIWPLTKLAPLDDVPIDALPPKDPLRKKRG